MRKLRKALKLRDITLTALLLTLSLFCVCFMLRDYADWYGMAALVPLFFGTWALTLGVLGLGLWLIHNGSGRAARLVCAAGMVLLVILAVVLGWGVWFRGHGVWRPWAGLSEDNVTRVALGVPFGWLADDVPEDLYYVKDWDSSVELTAEEGWRAVALLRDIRVKNPMVNEVLWDTPEGLPPVEGEPTEKLTLYYREGNIGRVYSVVVEYPYINGREAVDHGQARELELFINGLCEKYAEELAEYRASWDEYNERFNEELQKWRQERE